MALERISFLEASQSPYSDLVVEGKYMFLSGLISQDMDNGEVVYGTVVEETRRILDNLAMLLERYGSDMEHVIKAEVLLKDFSERDEMNAEYVRHFKPGSLPARLCYGNVGLHGECRVEIAVTAVKA